MDAKYFVLAATMSIVLRVRTTNQTLVSNTTAMLPDISWPLKNLSIGNLGKPCIEGTVCNLRVKCDPAVPGSCAALITMTLFISTNILFALSDNSSGYIAVGFSVDNQTTGNNTVYGCANDGGVVKLIHATLNNSNLTKDNSSTDEIHGMVNASWMSCNFTVNFLTLNNSLQNSSYIFFISGNFSNGTLGPVIRLFTYRDVIISSPGALGNNTNATALGANSTSTATPSNTTLTKPSTTTSTQLASNKTTTSTNLANPGNPSSMGNNAFQPYAAKATFILLGAVMVALISGCPG